MKIDLHIHTQKCKQGDSSKRRISPDNFVKKMQDNNVKIAAITNHNKFDLEEYEEITKLNESLVLFPGIELDVKIDSNDSRHIIVIGNPDKKSGFYEVFDNDEARNYDKFYLEYDEFVNKIKSFENSDVIIIPHFLDKDKLRSITISEKEKMITELSEFVFILEPASLKTMGIINAHEELSLIGSDVIDWDLYNSEKLPNLKFTINTFYKFYELAKDPTLFVKSHFEKATKINIPLTEERSPKVYGCDIELYKDINIIFGEKGSGKTYLLENSIYPDLIDRGKKAVFHKGSESEKQYKKLLNEFSDNIKIESELYEELTNDIGLILEYREAPIDDYIKKYFSYRESDVTNKKAKKIGKTDSIYTDKESDNFQLIIQTFEKDVKKVADVIALNNKYRNDNNNENKQSLNKELELLRSEISEIHLKKIKQIFVDRHTSEFLSNLKQSVNKKTQKESKPNHIGLKSMIVKRIDRMIINKVILQNFEKIKREDKQKIGVLPGKGHTYLNTEILVLGPEDKYTDTPFSKDTIVRNREIIKKIIKFNTKNFLNVNDYFTHDEKDIDVKSFMKDIIKKNDRVSIDGEPRYTPSTGEKSILSISAILENYSNDYYLFDEIERGLGNKYITEYIIPQLNRLRDMGKTIILTTHDANVAINSLPSQWIYSSYTDDQENIYYSGNMYSDQLFGIKNNIEKSWLEVAVEHLEGSESMFERRRNIYAI